MSWKKKLRKIMEEDPSALHPSLKALHARREAGKSWDRADWHDKGSNAHRSIVFFLQWLLARDLLTPAGRQAVQDFGVAPDKAALAAAYVEPRAAAFLDACYEQWYRTHGVNQAVDALVEGDHSAIDGLWAQYQSAR